MTPEEIERREREIERREKELHDHSIARIKHTTITQLIPLISSEVIESLKSSHFCSQVANIAEIKGDVKLLLSNQNAIKESIETRMKTCEEAQGKHNDRIGTLETTTKVLGAIGGVFVLIWTAGKMAFKQ
jgi:hypothetical protein